MASWWGPFLRALQTASGVTPALLTHCVLETPYDFMVRSLPEGPADSQWCYTSIVNSLCPRLHMASWWGLFLRALQTASGVPPALLTHCVLETPYGFMVRSLPEGPADSQWCYTSIVNSLCPRDSIWLHDEVSSWGPCRQPVVFHQHC